MKEILWEFIPGEHCWPWLPLSDSIYLHCLLLWDCAFTAPAYPVTLTSPLPSSDVGSIDLLVDNTYEKSCHYKEGWVGITKSEQNFLIAFRNGCLCFCLFVFHLTDHFLTYPWTCPSYIFLLKYIKCRKDKE